MDSLTSKDFVTTIVKYEEVYEKMVINQSQQYVQS